MQITLQILHYFKSVFVFGNFVLCLILLGRRLIETRRRSHMLLLAGLMIFGGSILITNYFVTRDMFLREREQTRVYLDLSHLTTFSAIVLCEIGLVCEIVAFFRRRTSSE